MKIFYPGDLVKVIKKVEPIHWDYGGIHWDYGGSRYKSIGSIYSIISLYYYHNNCYILSNGFIYNSECLKLVKRGKKIKQPKWKSCWKNN